MIEASGCKKRQIKREAKIGGAAVQTQQDMRVERQKETRGFITNEHHELSKGIDTVNEIHSRGYSHP